MRALAGRMTDTLVHRGPDDAGVWIDGDAGIALGFRRLSILDLSPAGHQPMVSSDGRYVVVFNGEIYNHPDLREALLERGAAFEGHSDTEVILESTIRWGFEATLERLWGMFAIALWDREARRLSLARDRLGKKPLYYGWQQGLFLFGSELKALRAHPAFEARLDRRAVASYVRFAYVPAPASIYEGVRKLAPGHLLHVDAGRATAPRAYWDARRLATCADRSQAAPSPVEAVEALDRLLRDAVARRMVADVPLGAFLSGGVDSATVVALMQAQSARPVRTFTIGFDIPGFNEAVHAKAVAAHLGTDHTELYVTPEEARAVIPRLPVIYDEPFADSSQIPTFLVSQMARRHVTVALSGDGGDELFAGYTRYAWAGNIWARVRHLPAGGRRLIARGIEAVSPRIWDRLYAGIETVLPRATRQSQPSDKLYKLAGVLPVAGPDELYLRLVSQWKRPDALVPGAAEYETALNDGEVPARLPDFTERMMFLDLVTYLPDDILAKVDRASMAVSLEARAPLLDHRVVEWAWQQPLSVKVRDGQSKWLLRQVLHRYVPRDLIERPKMGFGVPIGAWLRGPLREWAEHLLDARRLERQGIIDPRPVRALWQAHLTGRRDEQYRLWVVLMFQAWLDAWPAG